MSTEEGHQHYLQSEKDRYKRRKEQGKIKSINEMTNRQKRATRRGWRRSQRELRKKRMQLENLPTPMNSPEHGEPEADVDFLLPSPGRRQLEGNRGAGRRRVRKDRSKAYRTIQKLRIQLQKTEKAKQKYRKRLSRISSQKSTPRSKAEKMMRTGNRKAVKKQLLFANVLAGALRQAKTAKEKIVMKKLLSAKIAAKYRIWGKINKELGIKIGNKQYVIRRRTRLSAQVKRLRENVSNFL